VPAGTGTARSATSAGSTGAAAPFTRAYQPGNQPSATMAYAGALASQASAIDSGA
jgi:hypothetical protein